MINMLNNIGQFLNVPISLFFNELPYKMWPMQKIFEYDLVPPVFTYVFPKNGISINCDYNDEEKIRTIFLYANEYNGFDENLLGISFSMGREDIRKIFGMPSKSGNGITDSILGRFGPFDRYLVAKNSIHFEFEIAEDRIRLITLMRADVTP